MRRAAFWLGAILACGGPRLAAQGELRIVLPREISPARYAQVDEEELRRLAAQGWQLVSVSPYVLLNEERGPEGRKLAVTQTYPAYYFQRPRDSDRRWEIRAVFPREISPARYVQAPEAELQRLASDGWELVSVAPYVLRNEERGPEGRKEMVTQSYPAYFFIRLRRF